MPKTGMSNKQRRESTGAVGRTAYPPKRQAEYDKRVVRNAMEDSIADSSPSYESDSLARSHNKMYPPGKGYKKGGLVVRGTGAATKGKKFSRSG